MQGIKFNTQGIQSILDNRKTMTRRPIKVRTDIDKQAWIDTLIPDYCKYKIGETVFVQEEFVYYFDRNTQICGDLAYKEDEHDLFENWQSSEEMPQEHARIFLKITNIKVERLQDISEEDCIKEGIRKITFNWNGVSIGSRFTPNTGFEFIGNTIWGLAKDCFKEEIWNNLPYQPPYDWNSNPYVFVYEFKVIKEGE